jgi:hypothetical protein
VLDGESVTSREKYATVAAADRRVSQSCTIVFVFLSAPTDALDDDELIRFHSTNDEPTTYGCVPPVVLFLPFAEAQLTRIGHEVRSFVRDH